MNLRHTYYISLTCSLLFSLAWATVPVVASAPSSLTTHQNKALSFAIPDAAKSMSIHVPLNIAKKTLTLRVKQGQVIHLSAKPSTLFIADPEVADFQIKGENVLYLVGKKPGNTTLYATDSDNNILINDDIHVQVDLQQINEAIAIIAPKSMIQVKTVGDTIILQGVVKTTNIADNIQKFILQSVSKDIKILNLLKASQPSQIYLRVQMVEMSHKLSRQLGLQWSAGFNASHINIGINSAGASNNSVVTPGFNLNAFIDALDKEGLVTILSEPNLTALSGQTASFLAGGEFPMVISQGQLGGNTVQFKQYGVSLNFTPTLLDDNNINLKVAPQVSEISSINAVQVNGTAYPSLVTRKVDTTIQLHSGQSFAIAGLLQNNINKMVDKYPGLSNIPVMGRLFSSSHFQRDETELVVIVTPYIVQPMTPKAVNLPTSMLKNNKTTNPTGFVSDV